MVTLSLAGRVGVWNTVTKNWQVRSTGARATTGFPASTHAIPTAFEACAAMPRSATSPS